MILEKKLKARVIFNSILTDLHIILVDVPVQKIINFDHIRLEDKELLEPNSESQRNIFMEGPVENKDLIYSMSSSHSQ